MLAVVFDGIELLEALCGGVVRIGGSKGIVLRACRTLYRM